MKEKLEFVKEDVIKGLDNGDGAFWDTPPVLVPF